MQVQRRNIPTAIQPSPHFVQERASQPVLLGFLGVSPMSCFCVALYQSAGSVFFWLINVQFEVYYEPLGFNYYTITQSIPSHFIFMAFIMLLYVQ